MVYEKNAFSTPFLSGYKVLKIPIVNACGDPAWPELFSHARIAQMRETVGHRHFSAQMMLNFVQPERAHLDPAGLRFYDEEFDAHRSKIGPHTITGMILYWDPSSGRRRHDASACVLLYRDDRTKYVFVHDVLYLTVPDTEKYPLSHQCESVLDFMRTRNLYRISIEVNGLGIGLPEIMRDCALRRGANIFVNRVKNTKSKSDRILNAIEPLLSTGRLYVHSRVQNTPLLAEMLGWSPMGVGGMHDDGLDAIAGAIAQTPIPVHPIGSGVKTYAANTNFSV